VRRQELAEGVEPRNFVDTCERGALPPAAERGDDGTERAVAAGRREERPRRLQVLDAPAKRHEASVLPAPCPKRLELPSVPGGDEHFAAAGLREQGLDDALADAARAADDKNVPLLHHRDLR